MVMKKVENETTELVRNFFDHAPILHKGGLFETLIKKRITQGFNALVKFHPNLDPQNIHFPRVTSRKVFYPQVRCSIQMLYENAEATRLLGNTPALVATYYTPSTHRTYDFDDILIVPKEGVCHVLFIQITTDTSHDVVLSGFFGMLWFLLAVSHSHNDCRVVPWFVFLVPIAVFDMFKVLNAEYLKCFFKNIQILVIAETLQEDGLEKTNFFDMLPNNITKNRKLEKKEIKTQEEKDNMSLPVLIEQKLIYNKKVDLTISLDIRLELDLEKPEFVPGSVSWNENIFLTVKKKLVVMSKTTSTKFLDGTSDKNSNTISNKNSDRTSNGTSHKCSDETSHECSDGTSHEFPDAISNKNSDAISNKKNSDAISNKKNSDAISNKSSDAISNKSSDAISNKKNSDETIPSSNKITLSSYNLSDSYFSLGNYTIPENQNFFPDEYSQFFKTQKSCETNYYIDQLFSKCFHPDFICMLIYGMLLSIINIKRLNHLSTDKYLLRLYFSTEVDFNAAENVFLKMTGLKRLLENPNNLACE
jgi:hypothetical protein